MTCMTHGIHIQRCHLFSISSFGNSLKVIENSSCQWKILCSLIIIVPTMSTFSIVMFNIVDENDSLFHLIKVHLSLAGGMAMEVKSKTIQRRLVFPLVMALPSHNFSLKAIEHKAAWRWLRSVKEFITYKSSTHVIDEWK